MLRFTPPASGKAALAFPSLGTALVDSRAAMALSNPATRLATPFGDQGKPWLRGFNGTDDTLHKMIEYARGNEGERNARVRQWAESVTRYLQPKDYVSEIVALRSWAVGPWLRYANDARHVEQLKTPFRVLKEIEQYGTSLIDCDDVATLLAALAMQLGREAQYVVAGFRGDGEYTHVFCRVKEPRSGIWIVCDPVAGTRELEMLRAIKDYKTASVDE